ncbi:centrosomal protein of 170 kDa protein B-like isoform X2 [Myxocyprinus asiaticus]|uniref:centrosomal protein of 170 kDa protein B-like isoform X2 n=1 Tax=Myxocyprinus asiaticus TaxID=70543 RepID=UPI0022232691|nr:centrosomal protein of 170 kDa protein B-like isoform X2 [Myxocyprinus asiaticus]
MSVTSWFLVSSLGTRHRLPREMIFVGREDCELMLHSRSVDKQHAVINYDASTDKHLVKDLGSLNGTFVNDLRIPDQTYITLKLTDVIRFGYDSHIYILERSQHKLPEEALKHEKYTSQLQLSQDTLETKKHGHTDERRRNTNISRVKPDKTEHKKITDLSISRPTPLYGQPSWWGEADKDNKHQHCDQSGYENYTENQKEDIKRELTASPDDLQNGQDMSGYSYRKEPSYFEIPTKEIQSKPKTALLDVEEIPTKDTDHKPPATPPVVQGHASFTIEFDNQTPGKMKIKDHVTKFSIRQHRTPSKESIATLPEVMSVENKVADWLVQSDASMLRSLDGQSGSEELLNKTFKDGHLHEDGDLEDPEETQDLQSTSLLGPQKIVPPQPVTTPEEDDYRTNYTPESKNQGKQDPQQAFVIDFFDDGQRKKRSQSFTNNVSSPDLQNALRNKLDKRKGATTSSSHNPPTQQFTIPLKGSDSPQRAGSLRREKSQIRMSTSEFSSRSLSKPFGSVGRKSKLVQDFAAELLRVSKTSSASTLGSHSSRSNSTCVKTPYSTSALFPPTTNACFAVEHKSPTTSSHSHTHTMNQTYSTSLSQQSRPQNPSSVPMEDNNKDVKTLGPKQEEEEDSLSDAGTYTIETEGPDKEVVEARSMIDQVFGVGDSSQILAAATFKPIVDHSAGHDSILLSENSSSPKLGQYPTDHSDTAKSPGQIQSKATLTPEGTRWVSRWASLADSYSDSVPAPGLFDIPSQVELSPGAGGKIIHQVMLNRGADCSEGQSSRKRRVLPLVPLKEKTETPPPTILVQLDPYLSVGERSFQVQKQKWDPQKLSVQDDLDPDSLSDASKSDDSSVVEQSRKPSGRTEMMGNQSPKALPKQEELPTSDVAKTKKDQDSPPKFSTATVMRQYAKLSKNNYSPPNTDQNKIASLSINNSISLIRQESYTKECSSDNDQLSKLPHISSPPSSRDQETVGAFKVVNSQDTQSYLKHTEDILAALEAKLLNQDNGKSHLGDSASGESDVDTSSTVSGKNAPDSVPKKPLVLKGLLRDKTASSQYTRGLKTSGDPWSKNSQSCVKDRNGKVEPNKCFQLRRSLSSLDSGPDPQSSTTRNRTDAVSDQESSSQPYKKYTVPLQRDNSSKSKSTLNQGLSRSSSLSAPRSTRTSVLRRARLGDASDNEGTETERMSQNSDSNPSSNKVTQESKKLSRLDILALPRKRTGSFTTPSDTESSTSRTGFSNHSTESGSSVRKASVPDPKALLHKATVATNRQPIIRGRSSSAKYVSSTARAQQTSRIHPPGPVRAGPRLRDSDGEGQESDAFQNWTSHSAEIARLSQDLAKDLAILAQEIHDVAGDTESQSASADSVGPTLSAHEEIPEASLNFQKESPGPVMVEESEQTFRNEDIKQQSFRQDEVTLNNVMLTPVSQLSLTIRENTEQLTEKIKALFNNKTDALREFEAGINAADDSPPLKTSNKEIASILRELGRVQKQLEVINTIIDPRGNPDLGKTFSTGGLSAAGIRSSRPVSRNWRSSPRGGGPTPSARRMFRSSDREGSLD